MPRVADAGCCTRGACNCGWLYKDPGVRMETKIDRLSSGLFGGMNLIVNRFTGPGRVGIQSMYMHFGDSE